MRMTLMIKLLLSFALVALFVGLGGSYVLYQLGNVDAAYDHVMDEVQPASRQAAKVQAGVHRQVSALRGFLLEGSSQLEAEYVLARNDLQIDLAKLGTYAADDQEAQAGVQKLKKLSQEFTWPEIFSLVREGKVAEAQWIANNQAAPIAAEMGALAANVAGRFAAEAQSDAELASQVARMARLQGYAIFTAALLAALLAGGLMARFISRMVRRIAIVAEAVTMGNLQVEPITGLSRDELGDLAGSFNQMVFSLRGLVLSVTDSTNQMAAAAETLSEVSGLASEASGQAAGAVTRVAAGASRQAESTAEVGRTVDQLKRAIEQVAAGAGQTSRDIQQASETLTQMVTDLEGTARSSAEHAAIAATASGNAARGARTVEETIAGMGRIRESVGASAERIGRLADVSRQIGAITQAISAIAGQTNMLALNAAIEAARAGEHGRGFAVVADEIRKLAAGAANSTREIAELIGTIQEETQAAVRAMEAGRAEVEAGATLAAGAGTTLREMETAAAQTAKAVQAVADQVHASFGRVHVVTRAFELVAAVTEQNTAATEEMAASAQVVNESVVGISTVAQENAAVAEEVSASTEEVTASAQAVSAAAGDLQAIARRLREQVEQFKA